MRYVITILLCSLFVPASLMARDIAGVDVPGQVTLEATDTPLQLNGAGIRKKLFVKVYVGSLYLTEKTTDASQAIRMGGPKRIAMNFLYKEIDAEKMTGGWIEGFENNNPPADLEKLKGRLADFNRLFGTSRKGDVIDVDWVPGKGTQVAMNGEVKGTIPGEDFYQAVMKIWLGKKPADSDLKDAMLGKD